VVPLLVGRKITLELQVELVGLVSMVSSWVVLVLLSLSWVQHLPSNYVTTPLYEELLVMLYDPCIQLMELVSHLDVLSWWPPSWAAAGEKARQELPYHTLYFTVCSSNSLGGNEIYEIQLSVLFCSRTKLMSIPRHAALPE